MNSYLCILKGPEAGTYLPKRIYNMNQKTEQLQDLALGFYLVVPMPKKNCSRHSHILRLILYGQLNSYNTMNSYAL